MPRRKVTIDPIDTILTFAEQGPTETIQIMIGLLQRELKKRQPQTEETQPQRKVVRRRRKPPVQQAQSAEPEPAENETPAQTAAPKRRGRPRRLTANSLPPPNEATPIVPLQDTVGDDDAYTGQ
jgi:hypothetical protein